MSQFTLEQLVASLSALSIDAACILNVHANTSTQAVAGPLQTIIHCVNCSYPNVVNILAVPTVMGIPLPCSRVGGQTSLPALATSAMLRVPPASVRPPVGPTPIIYLVPTPIFYAHPTPVVQANPDLVPVAQASPTPVPVAQANPVPIPIIQANPAPAPISTDSSPVVPQSAMASISSGRDGPWYVVSKGQDVGVFHGWQQVSNLVTGVGRACFFRCLMCAAAQASFNEALATGAVEIL
ncbi:uncharacterized protein ARMOST_04299 [Armillaria ostoyae]|uniref:Ribonuclease H1 N-terminal domain-containing protein n=1 Tax=Armillaria ostoyae TaxID=47428 RepID=A0A284QX14_ARMOS|nr:uncharacterized protein ARMOST_04299 [Armillaria ostoyae]